MSEVDATDHVHALVDTGRVSKAIADRLDENGYETIADLLIADQEGLEAVPYVGEQRAADILSTVDVVTGDPEPRDVDVETTESVVTEAAPQNGTATLESDDPGPLVDPVDVVLEATLGEKLQITLAERDAWATPWNVIEAPKPVEWESAHGDDWHTRRLRMSESASGSAKKAREFDLVPAGDKIRVEDPPVKRVSHQPDAPGWGVESVGAVGRVSTTALVQLQADDQEDAKPEGDDSWRQYHRGETA